MNWLLIDNSNTRTKLALGNAGSLGTWRATLPTAELTEETLNAALEGVAFDAVVVGSVVPNKGDLIEHVLGRRVAVHRLGHRSPLGIGIDYPLPAQIGADRLANAAAVAARHGAPAIVIDFGTAVTFDVVSAAPAYCGGVIAPGLGAMSGYLPQKTALLPRIEIEEPPSAIGKSTEHAMQAGAVIGYRGLVREILTRVRAEMEGPPHIIATGGDAALIARGLPEIECVDPDITLEGLRQVALRVFGAG